MEDSCNQKKFLPSIKSPSDLRKLSVDQLPAVCLEIRQYLIESLSVNPGHFASSMGAVDLIVALHYVFDTPSDRLVWDVGHQAYAHKILTGRQEEFKSQRTLGGISGFPNPQENNADTFTAGHAGNSISAGLGMAIADMNTPGNENRKTIAIIGDASISGGLAFEGLNNVSNNPNNLLIILNDNDMSIGNNVGALHSYLSDLTTSAGYNKLRNKVAIFLKKIGLLTENRRRALIRLGNSIKSIVSRKQNIFEGLNIRYFGPFDGHDVKKLVKILQDIKEMKGPRLLHIYTTKGKGFDAAEKDPTTWHAPGKFDPDSGERFCKNKKSGDLLWQEVFGEALVNIAGLDKRVVGITAAMKAGTSLNKLYEKMPDRVYDVGISEGHAVTFAGGMAAAGKRPYVAIYSSFLQRAYDNIIHDVAIQGLPVTFCIDRAGLVGEDGVTHHGFFDLVYLNCIPGLSIASPADAETLSDLMITSLDFDSPLAIRYPRGFCGEYDVSRKPSEIKVGKGRQIISKDNAGIAILTLGPVLNNAIEACEKLEAEGINVDLFDMIWMKPLDTQLLNDIISRYRFILTVEDGMVAGGFGSSINDYIQKSELNPKVVNLGIPDKWIAHGTVNQLQHLCGYDAEGIFTTVKDSLKDLNL